LTVLAGIDEAGYGPRLGPLVTGAAAFSLPGSREDGLPDLWEVLDPAVCRPGRGSERRLAVGDSKKLYGRAGGLARLELAVLGFLASAAGEGPGTADELTSSLLSPGCLRSLRDHPWYADRGERLPLEADGGLAAELVAGLREACARREVETVLLTGRLLAEGEFNRRVREADNKATVLAGLVVELLRELRGVAGTQPLRVSVDRLGGRTDYAPLLSAAFPEGFVWQEDRTPERQCYRVEGLAGPTRVEFLVKADSQRFAVALASMTGKYVREILMRRLNAYWQDLDPQVPTTSGYHADAGPFLRAVEEHRHRMGVTEEQLIRSR
jgi:hypothetical protein